MTSNRHATIFCEAVLRVACLFSLLTRLHRRSVLFMLFMCVITIIIEGPGKGGVGGSCRQLGTVRGESTRLESNGISRRWCSIIRTSALAPKRCRSCQLSARQGQGRGHHPLKGVVRMKQCYYNNTTLCVGKQWKLWKHLLVTTIKHDHRTTSQFFVILYYCGIVLAFLCSRLSQLVDFPPTKGIISAISPIFPSLFRFLPLAFFLPFLSPSILQPLHICYS